MMHERRQYFKHVDECHEYTNPRSAHPFGLDLRSHEAGEPLIRIDFVGAHATDMSVEVSLAHVRFWAAYCDHNRIKNLRVINMPNGSGVRGQSYVFFEVWTFYQVIISGKTTDCSGAGNVAREQLKNVFAVLSHTYGIEIERVQFDTSISIRDLYVDEVD